jgi:hypothetical protein
MTVAVDAAICNDCGFPTTWMTDRAIRKGSSVREPGEAVCASCSSSRTKMVRELDALPNTLDQIKAMRMQR